MGGEDPATLKKLASLRGGGGREEGGCGYAGPDHLYLSGRMRSCIKHLGELWFAQGNYAGAIREYGAVVAMNPLDKAGAQYDLAQAYFAAGQRRRRRRRACCWRWRPLRGLGRRRSCCWRLQSMPGD